MSLAAEAVRSELTTAVKAIIRASPGDSMKGRIRAAARYLKLPFSRTSDYWYERVRRIEAHEADQIRAYYQAAQELIQARADYEKIREGFLCTNPTLARLAPGPLEDTALSNEARLASAKRTTE